MRWPRDSKERHGPLLHFDRMVWGAFPAGIRNGEFDRPGFWVNADMNARDFRGVMAALVKRSKVAP